jgi:hypothetical protein
MLQGSRKELAGISSDTSSSICWKYDMKNKHFVTVLLERSIDLTG